MIQFPELGEVEESSDVSRIFSILSAALECEECSLSTKIVRAEGFLSESDSVAKGERAE